MAKNHEDPNDDSGGGLGEWEAPAPSEIKTHLKSNWYYYVVAAVIVAVLFRSCS